MESEESAGREQMEQGGGAPKNIPSGDGEAAPGQHDGTPEQVCLCERVVRFGSCIGVFSDQRDCPISA